MGDSSNCSKVRVMQIHNGFFNRAINMLNKFNETGQQNFNFCYYTIHTVSPNEVTTSKVIEKIYEIVRNDRKVRGSAVNVGILIEWVQKMFSVRLDKKKFSTKMVSMIEHN